MLQHPALWGVLARIPLPSQAFRRTFLGLQAVYGTGLTHCDLMHRGSHVFHNDQSAAIAGQRFQPSTNNFDTEASLTDHNDAIDRMLAIDYKTYLPDDILTKVDRATMSVSLEGREPLLDYRLAELAAQLPTRFKIRDGERKVLLKMLAHRTLARIDDEAAQEGI